MVDPRDDLVIEGYLLLHIEDSLRDFIAKCGLPISNSLKTYLVNLLGLEIESHEVSRADA